MVHGVPGNPFLPFLPRPGADRAPWVQTDARVQELLGEVDADVVVCGHTHTAMLRRAASRVRPDVLIVNPGSLSYGRGRDAVVGKATYALLDWSAARGWQATTARSALRPGALARGAAGLARRLPRGGICRQPDAAGGRRGRAGAAFRLRPLPLGRRAGLVGTPG